MDKRAVEQGLRRKGFELSNGDHKYFIYNTIDGKKTRIKTKTSHGSSSYKDLSPDLISMMARQCELTASDFKNLINCPLSREGYEEMLRIKNCIKLTLPISF